MTLVSKTVLRIVDIDILLEVKKLKKGIFLLQYPKPELGKWQNPLPVKYT